MTGLTNYRRLLTSAQTHTCSFLWNTYPSKKYQNFPIVLGWKFKGNGPVSIENLRETEISISSLGNGGEISPFSQNFPNKKCGGISSFFAVYLYEGFSLDEVAFSKMTRPFLQLCFELETSTESSLETR